ncbi:MAG: hypothetical protein A2V88_14845 [Elusimicrobia bacterium RBG_16_66_12]|nr:MAG: hypothetical protein A2V88_14845 [Elusimicrobia bacterium RBG_16_66_12]
MLERTELERFVEQYADKAYWFAFGLSRNEPDARELVQAAFVKLFDCVDAYDPGLGTLENWFLTILRNIHLDFVRRAERRHGISLDMPILGMEGLTVADTLPDRRDQALLDRLERNETGERVRAAMEELTPMLREVLILVDMEGLRYEQVADMLGCPLNTIRSRIVRARLTLKERLLEKEVAP